MRFNFLKFVFNIQFTCLIAELYTYLFLMKFEILIRMYVNLIYCNSRTVMLIHFGMDECYKILSMYI